jgi:hypothetical protein
MGVGAGTFFAGTNLKKIDSNLFHQEDRSKLKSAVDRGKASWRKSS